MDSLRQVQNTRNRLRWGGFSLIELMITIVIIGLLVAIAVPIYTNNVRHARRAEADQALHSIYRDIRVYQADHGEFPWEAPAAPVVGASWNSIRPGELNGAFFSDSSYSYRCANGMEFELICGKGSVLDFDRVLREDGIIHDE